MDYQAEAQRLRKSFQNYHFQPRTIDDRFSEDVFKAFLDAVDGSKQYLTEVDLRQLEPFRTTIDDELNGKGWKFLTTATPILKKALERAKEVIHAETQVAFPMISTESFKEDTVRWSADEKELHKRWRAYLHFQTLDKMAFRKEGVTGDVKTFFTKNEPDIRAKIVKSEVRSLNRILRHATGFEDYVASVFFQNVSTVFDAHSSYIGSNLIENFISSQSTEGYFFGVTIDENEHGDVIISDVTPGSPAWKSGAVEEGDELTSIKVGDKPARKDDLSMEEVNEILTQANHVPVDFGLRNKMGREKTVRLIKEKIPVEQNYVRSYLMIGTGGRRIGYIYLPNFYSQWSDDGTGSRCANDVAMELIKLSKEKIEGVILDVRDNGGGSLHEASSLTGIFIDEGAIAITKNRLNVAELLKDNFRGLIYDGPLILMVNSRSASASEVLAGALQDYNRAVIVGDRTFGKASAQRLYSLDLTHPSPSLESMEKGIGYSMITIQKIYRVTGKTAQLHGVTPDIQLPSIQYQGRIRESQMPFALASDSVIKKSFYKPLPKLPIQSLQERSKTRVQSNQRFTTIKTTGDWLSKTITSESNQVSLNWLTFSGKSNEAMGQVRAFEKITSDTTSAYDIKTQARDEVRLEFDQYAKAYNDRWVKKLKSDIYLEETYYIMNDLLELNKNKK